MAILYESSFSDIRFTHTRDERPDSDAFKMHTHDECEICFFYSGKAVFHIEGSQYPLQSGDILIMRPAESHYIRVDSSQPYERAVLHFSPQLVEQIDPERALLKPFYDREAGHMNRFRDSDFSDPDHLVYLRNFQKPSTAQRLQITTSLFPLLNDLYKIFLCRDEEQIDAGNNDTTAGRMIRYINRHLHDPLDLNRICERFFISRSQLCRIFKQATGTSVRDYITVKRLIEARDYLRGGMSAQKVATNCGFNDYSAFYRAYCKRFGVSPQQEKNGRPADEEA